MTSGSSRITTRATIRPSARRSTRFTPRWSLPGGGIDLGEPIEDGARREVYEETGWSIAAPRRIGAFRRFVYMPEYDLWAEKICHIFIARPLLRLGEPTEPDHAALWMAPGKAARTLGNAGDRWFAGRFGS